MAPNLILILAGIAAAWMMLSIIGGERQRVLQNAQQARKRAEPQPDAPANAIGKKPGPSSQGKSI